MFLRIYGKVFFLAGAAARILSGAICTSSSADSGLVGTLARLAGMRSLVIRWKNLRLLPFLWSFAHRSCVARVAEEGLARKRR